MAHKEKDLSCRRKVYRLLGLNGYLDRMQKSGISDE